MSHVPVTDPELPRHARTFTSEVVAAEQLTARSSTLSYFAHSVAKQLGTTSSELQQHLADGPYLSSLMETPLGNAAVVVLPMTFVEMIQDPDLTVRYGQAALELSLGMGARHVSLAGLLASALRYGELLKTQDGVLTTGHATTAASILKTVEAVLLTCGRNWRAESVAVLGAGSIGKASTSALLALLGLPGSLVLADLVAKQNETMRFAEELRARHPGLEVSFADATRRPDSPLYRATFIIGCTSTPYVLQVEDLRPGAIVVDDSVPHCFNVERAFSRVAESADLVLANGGTLRFASEFDSHAFAPRLLHSRLGWDAGTRQVSDITSCTLSPLLMTHEPDLPATIGQGASAADVLANYRGLDRFSITAPPIRCAGRSPSPAYLTRFAERFGSR
ncbi:hypothetical protein ACI2K4_00195 [Micromonospora sp. NPDC050397]|uniref:hypothetical protein n=1 Tax=Micromonospora sp. NPDC050397 TaxID=3364279 RepID=UPI00384C8E24